MNGLVAPATSEPATSPTMLAEPSREELIELCAEDTGFYGHTFFPETFRQNSPRFHYEMDALLDDSAHRYVAFEAFRGSAKTSKLRVYLTKRIAFGISRTIMLVSSSQTNAKMTLQWLKGQVEHNKAWTSTFGLEASRPWTDEHIRIKHTAFGHTVNVIAVGITGQTRGINIDDWRPDLILVDDPSDEESTGTMEQRKKANDLFFGAIQKSLAPASEAPQAKMVLLQTSLQKDDLINQCHRTEGWATRRYSCFTGDGRSSWPERFSKEELLAEKQQHIDRNQLLLWLREMEVTTGAEETADFRQEWLQYWETLPQAMVVVGAIDPVPPPTEVAVQKGLQDNDYEVLTVVGFYAGKRFLLEQAANRGHEPEWTVNEFFRLQDKWRPLKWRVEGTAYQRTLKWILEQEMKRRKRYVQINSPRDTRKKRHRILGAISGIASQRLLYIHPSMVDFIDQFTTYPNASHDDHLDSLAMALDEGMEMNADDIIEGEFERVGEDQKPLNFVRVAP